MSQIEEYHRRITAALDRIGQGLEGMQAGGDPAELETLKQQLEDERLANAQLEERLKALKEKQELGRAEAELAEAERAQTVMKLDGELQSLRKANQQLRDNNKALREANAAGVAEPHLINKAMLAELEGLRASRDTDRAEVEAILADLGAAIGWAADGDATQATEEA